MPVVIVAILDKAKDVQALHRALPVSIPMATEEVLYDHLRGYPFESILECNVRPAAQKCVKAWLEANAKKG